MASYLRPRRGKKATAESQAIVLKKGEVFFEVPTTGVGTGAGKIKMGDGVTAYSALPYFSEEIPKVEDAVIGFTDSNTETAASNNSTYLTNIKPANSLKTIFTNLKQLLYNYNAEITQLNNDLISVGLNHNGIFRGKNLGTISSVAQWEAFRIAHKINTFEYYDLYLGDYITIQDGTYNVEWMVAGFDMYVNKGRDGYITGRGVSFIPRNILTTGAMNDTNTTAGGFKGSKMYTTTLPAVTTALQTVLSSYLKPMEVLVSNSVNNNVSPMGNSGWTGMADNWEWVNIYCTLMTEIQVYGSTVWSSSGYDIGEGYNKLPVFNFVDPNQYGRSAFWLRAVASSSNFAYADGTGVAGCDGASDSWGGVRPLILLA